jgi:hypothetical protein
MFVISMCLEGGDDSDQWTEGYYRHRTHVSCFGRVHSLCRGWGVHCELATLPDLNNLGPPPTQVFRGTKELTGPNLNMLLSYRRSAEVLEHKGAIRKLVLTYRQCPRNISGDLLCDVWIHVLVRLRLYDKFFVVPWNAEG